MRDGCPEVLVRVGDRTITARDVVRAVNHRTGATIPRDGWRSAAQIAGGAHLWALDDTGRGVLLEAGADGRVEVLAAAPEPPPRDLARAGVDVYTNNTLRLLWTLLLDNLRAWPEGRGTLPIALIGGTGIGKTSILRTMARSLGVTLEHIMCARLSTKNLLVQHIPADELDKDVPASETLVLHRLADPRDGLPVLLFLDEFNRAAPNIQNALLPLLSDRLLPNGRYATHVFCIVVAFNDSGVYSVWDLDAAGRKRFIPLHLDGEMTGAWSWLAGSTGRELSEHLLWRDVEVPDAAVTLVHRVAHHWYMHLPVGRDPVAFPVGDPVGVPDLDVLPAPQRPRISEYLGEVLVPLLSPEAARGVATALLSGVDAAPVVAAFTAGREGIIWPGCPLDHDHTPDCVAAGDHTGRFVDHVRSELVGAGFGCPAPDRSPAAAAEVILRSRAGHNNTLTAPARVGGDPVRDAGTILHRWSSALRQGLDPTTVADVRPGDTQDRGVRDREVLEAAELLNPRVLDHMVNLARFGLPLRLALPPTRGKPFRLPNPVRDRERQGSDLTDALVSRIGEALGVNPEGEVREGPALVRRVLEMAVRTGSSVRFLGPAGIGKSNAIRAHLTDLGIQSFQLKITDIQQLKAFLTTGDGRFVEAFPGMLQVRQPYVLILDEFSRLDAQSQNELMGVVDNLELFDVRIPNLVCCVALDNVAAELTGAAHDITPLDPAQASRFCASVFVTADDLGAWDYLARTEGDLARRFLEVLRGPDLQPWQRAAFDPRTVQTMVRVWESIQSMADAGTITGADAVELLRPLIPVVTATDSRTRVLAIDPEFLVHRVFNTPAYEQRWSRLAAMVTSAGADGVRGADLGGAAGAAAILDLIDTLPGSVHDTPVSQEASRIIQEVIVRDFPSLADGFVSRQGVRHPDRFPILLKVKAGADPATAVPGGDAGVGVGERAVTNVSARSRTKDIGFFAEGT